MPYLSRADLLFNTLKSYTELYLERTDWEVVLVIDNKNTVEDKTELFLLVNRFLINIAMINFDKGRECYNPAPLFNTGVSVARGDILILTSPECEHKTDILSELDGEFFWKDNWKKYVVCACKNLGYEQTGKGVEWYQHSKKRNKKYHFCSALPKRLYKNIGGFDEEYGGGIAYDDDDFLRTLQNDKEIKIVTRDDLIAHHQYHEKRSVTVQGYREKLERNRNYYQKKWGSL